MAKELPPIENFTLSSDSEKRNEIGRFLHEISRLSIVRQQLKKIEQDSGGKTACLVCPQMGLDLAFVNKLNSQDNSGKNHVSREYVGVAIFGKKRCIGVAVCPDNRVVEYQKGILGNPSMENLRRMGAEVAVVSESDLPRWLNYYRQVEVGNLSGRIRGQALELSGLERISSEENEFLLSQLGVILKENRSYFEHYGVTRIEPRGGFDLAFVGERGELVAVPLYHVRRMAGMKEEILIETVDDKPVWCPGIVLRADGENKRDAYQEIDNLRRRHRHWIEEHGGENIGIPLASPHQLSLWRKLGLSGNLESRLSGTDLSVDEVIRFLYLGKSNFEPGEMVIMGRSLPGRGDEFSEMDIIFYLTDFRGNPSYRAVDGLIGLDPRKLKKGVFGVIRVPNVGGIIIFPSGWEIGHMRDYAKTIETDFVRRNGGPPSNILYLTRELFDFWKSRGSAFSFEGQEDYRQLTEGFEQDLRRKVEYGYGLGSSAKYFLGIWRPGAEIGGSKQAIIEVEGERQQNRVLTIVDWGKRFNSSPAFRDVTARPPTAIGLARDFEYGDLPMVKGIYEVRYLAQTVKNMPEVFSETTKNPVAIFVGAELVHRLRSGQIDEDELIRMLGGKPAKRFSGENGFGDDEDEDEELDSEAVRRGREMMEKLLKTRGQNEANLYRGGESMARAVIATHGHADHVGMMPFLDVEVPLCARTPTIAHILASSARAGVWRDKITYVSDLPQGADPAYPRIYRDLVPIHFTNYFRLGQNLALRMPLVDHSIDGAAMAQVLLGPKGKDGSIVFTGDFRMGEQTRESVELMRGSANTIVIESTHGDDWDPWLAGITENIVGEELRKIFIDRPQNMIILVCPHNNLERLRVVFDAAQMAGRRVALGFKHAEVIAQMRAARMLAPLKAEGFNSHLPEIGTDFSLWVPIKTRYSKYENALIGNAESCQGGIIKAGDLSEDPRNLVVVVDPAIRVDNAFAGIESRYPTTIVYSAYFPYEQDQKWAVGQMAEWAKRRRIEGREGEFIAPFDIHGRGGRVSFDNRLWRIHASGHASLEDSVNEVLIPIAEGNWKDLNIIVTHGEHPERTKAAIENLIKKRLGKFPKGTNVISNFDVYNPRRPFDMRGFFLEL